MVEQLAKNKPAVMFWRNVVDRYCGGRFEQKSRQFEWGAMNVLLFQNDGAADS